MLIPRTSWAWLVLVLVAATGPVYGQQKGCPQKCAPPPACGKCDSDCGGKGGIDLKPHFKSCADEKQGCAVQPDTKVYTGNAYQCQCTTVCLPKLDCGLGKGCLKGDCGACGPCQSCAPAMPAKGGGAQKGCGPCGSRSGFLASLLQKGGGSVGLGKGGCEPGKGDECGKGPSPLDLFTCKPRVKKHLLVKKVDVCELPTITCTVSGKGKGCDKGCGKGGVEGGGAIEPYADEVEPPAELEVEGDTVDAAPEIPDPPPLNVGRALRGSRTSTRYTRNGLFEVLLR